MKTNDKLKFYFFFFFLAVKYGVKKSKKPDFGGIFRPNFAI